MAKKESTAVNELINLVATQRPLRDPSDDLMFAEPPARGSRPLPAQAAPPPPPPPRAPLRSAPRMSSVLPPLRGDAVAPLPRSRAPSGTSENRLPSIPPMPVRISTAPHRVPSIPPLPSELAPPPVEPPIVAPAQVDTTARSATWFQKHDETYVGAPLQRAKPRSLARKLALPMVAAIALGAVVGVVIALRGQDRAPDAAPATQAIGQPGIEVVAPAAPAMPVAPAGEPAVDPAPPAPAAPAAPVAPAFVDVRIDSTPAGATVVLVDRGKTTFLGTTPMTASVDPVRSYELVFSYGDDAPRIEAFDPLATQHVSVELGARAQPAKAKDKKRERAERPERPERTDKRVAKAVEAPAAPRAKAAPAAAAAGAGGHGVLMVSAKPPCEIYIDGKPTGLVTPQRAIKLPAGSHKVTLVNAASNIKKTVAVEITADKSTKLIQDLMAK